MRRSWDLRRLIERSNSESKAMASNKERFLSALKISIKDMMAYHPERFSEVALEDKEYPKKFATHMLEKFQAGKVLVINETVADALSHLGRDEELLEAYRFLGLTAPGGETKANEVEEKPRKVIKKENTRPAPEPELPSFRGC